MIADSIDNVGRILAAVRERAMATQASVAKTMGTNATKVFRIESGDVCA